MVFNKIFNNDCFNIFKIIPKKSIDLVLVDLPYGPTSCDWDVKIDLKLMWDNLKTICKDNCQYVFFTTTRFGNDLINSNPKWFRYDLVWEKHNAVGFLNANKMPMRLHEMIYIFSSSNASDITLNNNLELRAYSKKIKEYINKSPPEINRELGNRKADHFLRYNSPQFSLPTDETYNKLIEIYQIDKMNGFITRDQMKLDKQSTKTYNPQKTPGKAYHTTGHPAKDTVYGKMKIVDRVNITGDRHPKSIIKFHQSDEKLHPTQKPSDLCEWLIKTYSNENDVVLDFTMGSGSTIIAAIKSNRRYMGIEKDKSIFEIAQTRINKHKNINVEI